MKLLLTTKKVNDLNHGINILNERIWTDVNRKAIRNLKNGKAQCLDFISNEQIKPSEE
jgi:hypothetical protein